MSIDEKFEYWQAIDEHHIRQRFAKQGKSRNLRNDLPLEIQKRIIKGQADKTKKPDWLKEKNNSTFYQSKLSFKDMQTTELRTPVFQQIPQFLLFVWLEDLSPAD